MKLTSDFAFLVKQEEQAIANREHSGPSLLSMIFEFEEKDYDTAIRIAKKYKKDTLVKSLESQKEDYLNTNYDNREERARFVKQYGNSSCPLWLPTRLEREIQKHRTWKAQKAVTQVIVDHFYSKAEYQVLQNIEKNAKELVSWWIDRRNYFEQKEEMDLRFQSMCEIDSNQMNKILTTA